MMRPNFGRISRRVTAETAEVPIVVSALFFFYTVFFVHFDDPLFPIKMLGASVLIFLVLFLLSMASE